MLRYSIACCNDVINHKTTMPLTNKPFLYTTPQLFFLNSLSSRDSGDTLSGATVRSVHSGQTPPPLNITTATNQLPRPYTE